MIKTTVVGSYPTPLWLRIHSTREALRDAIIVVLQTQEQAGIDVVADGELNRWDINHAETNGMIDFFVRPLENIRRNLSFEELQAWRANEQMKFRSAPPGIVTGPLGSGQLDLPGNYELFKGLTPKPKKFTVTSPYMLAKTLVDQHYRDTEALMMALADILRDQLLTIDAEVIQVDEANVTGHAEDGLMAARGINRVLEGVKGERAVHLCFGNYGGQTIQKGAYARLVALLNALEADHVVLEMARRTEDDLKALADVRPSLGMGIGVIDIKDNEVETPSEVAARIEAAAKVLGVERIHYVHPDCGFWMLPRPVADAKMRALVQGRDLFQG